MRVKFSTPTKLAPADPLAQMAGRREVWTRTHGRAIKHPDFYRRSS